MINIKKRISCYRIYYLELNREIELSLLFLICKAKFTIKFLFETDQLTNKNLNIFIKSTTN